MMRTKALRSWGAALALLAPANAFATHAATRPARTASIPRALRLSPALWATIDVCNPSDQPDTIGIRGSMPGDQKPHATMYMRFRLQYLVAATGRWVDLAKGANSDFVSVGAAKSARQAGWSFQVTPAAGQPATVLRGVVVFEWRHASNVVASISRATTARHESLAGADPAKFSAATCALG